MVLWKDVFLLLGRTGCWRVFPHGYSTFSVRSNASFLRLRDPLTITSDPRQRVLVRDTDLGALSHNLCVEPFSAVRRNRP